MLTDFQTLYLGPPLVSLKSVDCQMLNDEATHLAPPPFMRPIGKPRNVIVCMYVSVYIYIYIHVDIYIYIYIHITPTLD